MPVIVWFAMRSRMSALGRECPIAEMQKKAKHFTVTITGDEFGNRAAAQQRRANGPACEPAKALVALQLECAGVEVAANLRPLTWGRCFIWQHYWEVGPDVVLRRFVLLVAILLGHLIRPQCCC
jgi:hypothetical protein